LLVACLGTSLPTTAGTPSAQAGLLDLSASIFDDRQVLPLAGEWEFYWHQLLTPATIASATGRRVHVPVPGVWTDYPGELPVQGYATWRLLVKLPKAGQVLAIQTAGQRTAYQLWVDGSFLGGVGHPGIDPESSIPDKRRATFLFESRPGLTEIIIQVANFDHREAGLRYPLYLGRPAAIQAMEARATSVNALLFGMLAIMGVYHLFLFLFRRTDHSNLYFSLLTFCVALRGELSDQGVLSWLTALPWTWALKLEYLALFLILPLYTAYMHTLYPQEFGRKLLCALAIMSSLFAVAVLALPTLYSSQVIPIYQWVYVAAIAILFCLLLQVVSHRREYAKSMLFAGIILAGCNLGELLYMRGVPGAGRLSSAGFVVFLLVQGIVLAARYSQTVTQATNLAMAATLDPLTRVLNRRAFQEIAAKEFEQAVQRDLPLSLLLLDVDHFKAINDRFGHLTGDQVLASVAQTLQQSTRSTDTLARYGGEEFIVLMPATDLQRAHVRAEELRQRLAHLSMAKRQQDDIRITVSIGIACTPPATDLRTLIEQADLALYEAKGRGRNRSKAWHKATR